MGFKRRVKYYLVHTLKFTNKQAQEVIDAGKVQINNSVINSNVNLNSIDTLKVNNEIVKVGTTYKYFLFNKPIGYTSSLNKKIKHNISDFFDGFENLAIAGRLDRASEGLLLISNDGKWIQALTHPSFEKEKEYVVTVNFNITEQFISAFEKGVDIGICVTKPCSLTKIDDTTFNVVLTEGKNKQIRRTCKALGYKVLTLKRIRIANYNLSELRSGKSLELNLK